MLNLRRAKHALPNAINDDASYTKSVSWKAAWLSGPATPMLPAELSDE